eukprot:gb/GECH01013971.1/.p1 GENE.gb/GECH01013971.1/~~gb/GECH01013971.1/.p1  ORF type:complete len:285 (+),score=56.90 gb/GECH01013971.1/:1-855(+)
MRNCRNRVAIAQLTSTENRSDNFKRVSRIVQDSVHQDGASAVFFPECFSFIGTSSSATVAAGTSLESDVFQEYRDLAKEHKVWISYGGFPEIVPNDETRVYNTHTIIDEEGNIAANYRKIHLFDVNIPNGPIIMESKYTAPGDHLIVTQDIPVAMRLGLSVCYDLRFPEMYSLLRRNDANVILVPSAFTKPTGKAHWEVLLRSRAIETQSFVIAAAQTGQHNSKRASYGHSMVVDPWGKILMDMDPELSNTYRMVDLDMDHLNRLRKEMPVYSHRREDIYNRHW